MCVVAEEGGLMTQRREGGLVLSGEIFYGDRERVGMQFLLTPIFFMGEVLGGERVFTSASHHKLRIQHPNSICKPKVKVNSCVRGRNGRLVTSYIYLPHVVAHTLQQDETCPA